MSGVSSFVTKQLLEPLLRNSDDTAMMHRKYVVAGYLSVSVPEFLYGLCLTPYHDRALFMLVLCLVYGIVGGMLYLIMRVRRKCELWYLFFTWLYVMQANFLQSSWFHNNAIHCTTVQTVLSASLVVARPPKWFLALCVLSSVSMTSLFIIGDHYDFGLFSFLPSPGQYLNIPTPLSILAGGLMVFWLLTLVGAVYAVVSMLEHEENKADLTIKVAKATALGLSLYDIDSVKEMLNRYEESEDSDIEMKNIIMSICENMEKYKSYLPNWLINTEENDFVFESEDDEAESGQVTPATKANQNLEVSVLSTKAEMVAESPQETPRQLGLMTSKSKSRRQLDRVAIFKVFESSQNETTSQNDTKMNPLALEVTEVDGSDGVPTPLQRFASRGGISPANHFFGKITFASIDFDLSGAGLGAAIQVSLNHFVETLTDLVSATHGALHSISGDTAQLSWNAVERVAQSENKALKVVNLLRENDRFAMSKVQASGAISTGDAKCFDAGRKVHSTVVSPVGWKEAHGEMRQIAQKYRCFVCDAATFEQAKYHHELAAVDYVELSSTKSQSSPSGPKRPLPLQAIVLYEVVRLAKSSTDDTAMKEREDSEWMYQLQETENASTASKISKVLDSLAFPTTPLTSEDSSTGSSLQEAEKSMRKLLETKKAFFEMNPLSRRLVTKVLRLARMRPQSSPVDFKQSWYSILAEDDI